MAWGLVLRGDWRPSEIGVPLKKLFSRKKLANDAGGEKMFGENSGRFIRALFKDSTFLIAFPCGQAGNARVEAKISC